MIQPRSPPPSRRPTTPANNPADARDDAAEPRIPIFERVLTNVTVGGERNPVLAVGGASHSGRTADPECDRSAAAGSSTPHIWCDSWTLPMVGPSPVPSYSTAPARRRDNARVRWTNLSEATIVPSADRSRRRIRRPHCHAGRGAARCRPPTLGTCGRRDLTAPQRYLQAQLYADLRRSAASRARRRDSCRRRRW